jgi:hypothetical protein
MSILLSFACPLRQNAQGRLQKVSKEKDTTKTKTIFSFSQASALRLPEKIAVRTFRGRQPHTFRFMSFSKSFNFFNFLLEMTVTTLLLLPLLQNTFHILKVCSLRFCYHFFAK